MSGALNANGRWLSIIGIGEDGLAGLSDAAKTLIGGAALVVGGQRHLDLVAGTMKGEAMVWPSPLHDGFPAILERRGQAVAVIATGDPFFYGIGSVLAREVPPDEMLCLPGVSAFSLAAGRLGWALQDCALVTLHGRALERILPALQPRSRILALSWDGATPAKLAELLVRFGFGETLMTVCEAMGGPRERLRSVAARDFDLADTAPLNLIALDVLDGPGARAIPLTPGLPDDWFEHDGQLTKRDVRAITLSALAPRRGELLWDIGAGSGSIGIEWMLADPANRAIAIERDQARAGRIARNAASLGVPDLKIVQGAAPEALADLPMPDAIFIGGGSTAEGVIDAAWAALRSGGRLVVNGVTIETQAELTRRFKAQGGELIAIQISRADPVGGFHGMRPALPVTQWSVVKP
ncbi:MAG TPA: precorrin-6y C5,15-methyltransferase (decarboxylating) subunit CbiE [Alphaproteobacteria bacterium]|jgi:precorrin-6Y C5,15-methyltransferase (decarboxylating)|nr:precorrin-6y C5,15-methyltransferase (decarboxylating) subunit CbiE [Alphaproteobacteria bacterium]